MAQPAFKMHTKLRQLWVAKSHPVAALPMAL